VLLLAAAVAVLLPAAARGYINAGFKSQKEYDEYLKKQERLRNPQTAADYCARAGQRWDTTGAIADYTEAIRLDPSLLDAYLGRGYVCWRCEHYARAVADFEEARRRTRRTEPAPRLLAGSEFGRILRAMQREGRTEPAQRLLVVYTFCPDEKIRNPAKAVEMVREVSRGGYFVELLAETLARAGDFKGAAQEQARFLDTIRQKNWTGPAVTQAERRLKAYQRGQLPEPHPYWHRLGLPLPKEE
jgi:tetratricopeptide (TPR) repeat protein